MTYIMKIKNPDRIFCRDLNKIFCKELSFELSQFFVQFRNDFKSIANDSVIS